ncbi:DUF2218 domain-containing protein [Nocardioides panacisoli]|uniref:DUF2218 domain-containing protein n=1 Tax=Nocardioides panacisoli TaxID=627624 RepID=UPI001C636C53|nr:DUF2218 domain-containing protein [Nocardioides panacisoli]QYJ02801.1 DUF2218 domain-containing protein [Nocardioides panacisoli]
MTITLTGRARTDRAPRYLKQLCSHLGEKLAVEYDATSGRITYEDVTVHLTTTAASLDVALSGTERDHVLRAMGIVAGHLEKFGAREGLTCTWDDANLAAAYAAARDAGASRRQEEE